MNKCSQCGQMYFMSPYHTQDMKHVFCGPACSLHWHQENKKEEINNGK